MTDKLFWLSEAQMRKRRPRLPDKVRGVPRADDRRVISGIVHVLKPGCRWADTPSEYGPRKTLYNRWRRWAEKGSDHASDGSASSRPWPMRAARLPRSSSTVPPSAPTAPPAGEKGGRRRKASGARVGAARPRSTRAQIAGAAPSASR